jgi:pilus assembly protein CpaB
MIPKGMRAVAVHVNDVAGVAGFVVAGMRVDILISGNSPGGNGNLGTLTKTMLQDIEVLSAGQDFKKDAEGKPMAVQVVNLLVTPEQAEQLSLASNQTTLQLVLRNRLDREVAKTPGTALANLFSGAKGIAMARPPASEGQVARPRPAPRAAPAVVARALPPPPKETFTMEIISGSAKTEKKFDNNTEGK